MYRTKYGNKSYVVTRNEEEVFRFLGLPSDPSIEHFTNITWYKQKSLRKNLNNKILISFYTEYVEQKKVVRFKKHKTFSTEKNLEEIESFFKVKIEDVPKHLPHILPKGMSLKKIRNKFNGKLVMKWSGLKPGRLLSEVIEDFRKHAEFESGVGFLDYLNNSAPFKIRKDFLCFYFKLENMLGVLI